MDSIVFSGFTKKYGEFTAVDNFNLKIKKGTITGFVGKNGAGKSTTIRSMMNVIVPTSGTITINGLDCVKDSRKIKHIVSYIPGDTELFGNVTCGELLKFAGSFCGADYNRIKELAEYFELDLNKKTSDLSLGNRKKVSIIQALIKESEIIIMDEPTNGLDPLMQEKFFGKVMEKKKQGCTVFLSSHNLSEIEKYCDHVVIIKDGKLMDSLDMNKVRGNLKQSVSYTTSDGKSESFDYDGDINELIRKLAKLSLKTVEIRPASVEDTFIKYYDGERREDEDKNE